MDRKIAPLKRLKSRIKDIGSNVRGSANGILSRSEPNNNMPEYRPLASGISDLLFEEFGTNLGWYTNFYDDVENITLKELGQRFSKRELNRLQELQRQGKLIPPSDTNEVVTSMLADEMERAYGNHVFDLVEKRIREEYL